VQRTARHKQLRGLERPVLNHPGPPKSDDAKKHAKAQYKIFGEQRRAALKAKADEELKQLKAAAKALPDQKAAKKGAKRSKPRLS
jgi:hypothetical protein